jgi:hypothetical protein
MKVALLISGRAARYEVCLLPILQKCTYEVHVFMSINDEDCEYYTVMRERLNPWLKGIVIQPYQFPDGFHTTYHDNYMYCYQKINDKWLPRNQLSMYSNDNKAFTMAIEYEQEYNIEYDIIMKFRSDICNTSLPQLISIDKNESVLYSIDPLCKFISFGIHKVPIVSSDWVWGNKKTMAVYCNTYEYVLKRNTEGNGNYLFHFESNHTDCMIDHAISIKYVPIYYNVDTHRKIFDTNWKKNENGEYNDSRKILMPNAHDFVDIKSVTSTDHIPVLPGR